MTTYWHKHPRGFANECSLARCETDAEAEEAEAAGYRRLKRTEVAQHIRFLNIENDAWGSGRAFGIIRLDDVLHDPSYGWR